MMRWHLRIQSLKKKVNHTIDHGDHFKAATAIQPDIIQPDFLATKRNSRLGSGQPSPQALPCVVIGGAWVWNTMFNGDEYITDRGAPIHHYTRRWNESVVKCR